MMSQALDDVSRMPAPLKTMLKKQILDGQVPVSLVIDAMIMAIEDDSLDSTALRVTPQFKIDIPDLNPKAKAKL